MKTLKSNRRDFTLKEKILYTGGSIVVVTGFFFLLRKLYRSYVSNKVEKKTLTEGTPETYAKLIKMAFENDSLPGTDMTKLRRVLIEIPSKAVLDQTANAYQRNYHQNMNKDLSNELQSSQYDEVLSIIHAKPDRIEKKGEPPAPLSDTNYTAWAKRLKAAFDKTYGPFPGTDEEAIKAVLNEIPTQAAFMEVFKAYYKEYKANLFEDLKSELELWELSSYMNMITSKPKK